MLFHSVLPEFFRPIVKGKDRVTREKLVCKSVDYAFELSYFVINVLGTWWLIKDSGYLPKGLGGTAETDYKQKWMTGFYEFDEILVDYTIILHGYHFGSILNHIFIAEKKTDWWEMLIHHLVTNCLYFSSVMSNWLPFGVVVLFIHDASDLPLKIGKISSSTVYEKVSIAVIPILLISWFYMRIFHFF